MTVIDIVPGFPRMRCIDVEWKSRLAPLLKKGYLIPILRQAERAVVQY